MQASRTIGQPPHPVEFHGFLVSYSAVAPVDTLAEIAGGPGYFQQIGPNMRRLHVPFATAAQVALAHDRIFAGNGATFDVQVLDDHGQLTEIWRLDTPARPVTAADVAADLVGCQHGSGVRPDVRTASRGCEPINVAEADLDRIAHIALPSGRPYGRLNGGLDRPDTATGAGNHLTR